MNGELKPGEQLDSESQLCRHFNVSRGPVRQALSTLPEIFSQEIEILRGYAILALDSLEIIK